MRKITIQKVEDNDYELIQKTALYNGESITEYCKRNVLKSISPKRIKKIKSFGSSTLKIDNVPLQVKNELKEIALDSGYSTLSAYIRHKLRNIVENEGRL